MRLQASLLALAIVAPTAVRAEMDTCVAGLWLMDLDDFAHIYADTMGATAATATGDVRLRVFPDGKASIGINDLVLGVEMPDMPPLKVTLQGGTDYDMTFLGESAMSFVTDTFSITATADVMGMPMVIPISSDDGLFGAGLPEYGCSEDSLSVETGDPVRFPRHWTRLPCTARSCEGAPES